MVINIKEIKCIVCGKNMAVRKIDVVYKVNDPWVEISLICVCGDYESRLTVEKDEYEGII